MGVLSVALEVAGLTLILVGLAVWYWPAAVVALGVMWFTAGWLTDVDREALDEEMEWDSEH